MALGALAANPDCDLRIVPVGMNYFHAHKFRSRAVIEFGVPIEVPRKLVDMYREGQKRESVQSLLEIIFNGLMAVTVTSPDYDTLMVCTTYKRGIMMRKGLIGVSRLSKLLVVCTSLRIRRPRYLPLSNSIAAW